MVEPVIAPPGPGIAFAVTGTPRPQPRPRFVRGRVISTANKHVLLWREAVTRAARQAMADAQAEPFVEPVSVDIVFTMPTRDSARWGLPHTFRPDKDNLEKLVLDCMVKARALRDDSLVAAGRAVKLWGEVGGVRVVARRMGSNWQQEARTATKHGLDRLG